MRGYQSGTNILWIVCVLGMLIPNVSEGSEGSHSEAKTFSVASVTGDDREGQRVIGVVSVDFGESERISNEKYRRRVIVWLNNENIQILEPAALASRLRQRQVEQPEAAIAEKFEGIESAVSQGTEDFYYKGNSAAIGALGPVFEEGIAHMDVTARNPVYVEQVFQAGLMLIRAYSGGDEPELASEVARKLAVYFPGKEPSLSLVPPEVVQVWREEVAKLASADTRMVLEHAEAERCETRINGVPTGSGAMVVQAGMDYMVSLDCGQASGLLWRVKIGAGEHAQIPLAPVDSLKNSRIVTDESLKDQKMALGLKALSYWADIDTVLGVYSDGDQRGVIRLERELSGENVTTEWVEKQSLDGMMLELFPHVALARAEKAEVDRLRAEAKPWISDWFTPVIFTAGVAAAAVGSVFIYDAAAQTKIMKCSPNVIQPANAEQCAGVEEVEFPNSEKYYEQWERVGHVRTIGYSFVGVGAALVGWGTWRLIFASESSEPALGGEVGLWGGKESVGATAKWRF